MSEDSLAQQTEHPAMPRMRLSELKRRNISGMVIVVAVKAAIVISNFTLITLAARALGVGAFGHYSILYSAASLLYIIASLGQEPFALRIWSEMTSSGDTARFKGALIFMTVASLCGTFAIAFLFWFWARTHVDSQTAWAALAYLAISSPLQILIHLARTEVGVLRSDGTSFLIIGLMPIAYLVFCLLSGNGATVAGLFLMLAGGAAVALVLLSVLMGSRISRRFPNLFRASAIFDYPTWIPRSGKLWLSVSLDATNQYIDVIIIGFLVDPAIAGAYFVIARLANLFAAAADAINLFATQHLPGLYYRNEQTALGRMLDNLAWMTLLFMGVGLIGIVVGGYPTLWIINKDYAHYFPQLLILCIGTAAVGAARASTLMLIIAGHEGRYLKIIAFSVLLRTACLLTFVPQFGITGAVVANAIAFAIQAGAAYRADKALTGLDASIFRLLRKKTEST